MLLVYLFEDRLRNQMPDVIALLHFPETSAASKDLSQASGRTFQFAVFKKGQATSRLSHDSSFFPIFSASPCSFSYFKICLGINFCISRRE